MSLLSSEFQKKGLLFQHLDIPLAGFEDTSLGSLKLNAYQARFLTSSSYFNVSSLKGKIPSDISKHLDLSGLPSSIKDGDKKPYDFSLVSSDVDMDPKNPVFYFALDAKSIASQGDNDYVSPSLLIVRAQENNPLRFAHVTSSLYSHLDTSIDKIRDDYVKISCVAPSKEDIEIMAMNELGHVFKNNDYSNELSTKLFNSAKQRLEQEINSTPLFPLYFNN
ncbi:MAG: hypothetical protein ACQESC_02455 [Nanobdellota archaeon]